MFSQQSRSTHIGSMKLTKTRTTPNSPNPAEEQREMTSSNVPLGKGPMRFAPSQQQQARRSVQEQMDSLAPAERDCVDALKSKWEKRYPSDHNTPLPNKVFLWFARCSPGAEPFNAKAAWKVMKKFDRRYLKLTASVLEFQLETKTFFPIPELKTADGCEVCYMRPSRYSPHIKPVEMLLDNCGYVTRTMSDKNEGVTSEGIAVLINMKDFTMKNFSTDYWFQFLDLLRGNKVPIRVNAILIVNAPTWFGSIWNMMQSMLPPVFLEKIHKLDEEADLGKYMQSDYQALLPDDTETGRASASDMVQDFIAYQKTVEGAGTAAISSCSLHGGNSSNRKSRTFGFKSLLSSSSGHSCTTASSASSYLSEDESCDSMANDSNW